MTSINPDINFNGNAEEAFTFYKSVLGGAFSKIIRFKDLAKQLKKDHLITQSGFTTFIA